MVVFGCRVLHPVFLVKYLYFFKQFRNMFVSFNSALCFLLFVELYYILELHKTTAELSRRVDIVLLSLIVCPFNTSLCGFGSFFTRFSHDKHIFEATQKEVETSGSVVPD